MIEIDSWFACKWSPFPNGARRFGRVALAGCIGLVPILLAQSVAPEKTAAPVLMPGDAAASVVETTAFLLAQETGAADTGSSITPGPAPEGTAPSPQLTQPTGPTPPGGVAPGETVPATTSETPEAEAPTFSLPGGNGFLPRTLTGGEGRFAQPPYRFTLSLSQGYDDNILTAPTHPVTEDTVVTVLVPQQQQVRAGTAFVGGFFVPVFRTDTKFVEQKIRIPAPKPVEKIGSLVTNARLAFQTQAANPRTVYTLDAALGVLYYWSRPGRATDYNANLGLAFLHKITPRMTLFTQADVVYTSQPDFSRINTPTSQTSGEYLSANARVDLGYQFTPRLSTSTNYTFNGTLLRQGGEGDVFINGLGFESRYLLSPRTTVILDLRENAATHPSSSGQDSASTFLLLGVDYTASRRLRLSALAGEEIRAYADSGGALSTPYFETTTTYAFSRGSTFAWTNRFGLEESGSATQSSLAYRTNLALNYVIGARTTASLGLAYNRVATSTIGTSRDEAIQQQIQGNFGLQYVVNRSLSFNLNYNFTQLLSDNPGTDYRRNQIFFGGSYSF